MIKLQKIDGITEKQAEQLQHAKGGMEIIKMIGSGLILTILCPLAVAKMVSPVMSAIKPLISPEEKSKSEITTENNNIVDIDNDDDAKEEDEID